MNNIYDDDTYSEGKDEEDDIYPKISENDTNSIVSNGNNYMHKENTYMDEYYNNGNNNNYFNSFFNKKPHTIIDYLNINSTEYKKNKMYQKIKSKLIGLKSLPIIYFDEICYLSLFYSKKLTHKKLSTIVPIIVYKIITKYNIKTISLKDLKKELNFSYKKYFKNEKLFTELNINVNINKNSLKNNINNIKTQNYSELVYNSVMRYIQIIKEKSQSSLNIIKIRKKKKMTQINKDIFKFNKFNEINGNKDSNNNNKIIENIYTKLSKEENDIEKLYCSPFIYELNNCQEQCKLFIYNNNGTSLDNNSIDKSINNNNKKIISLKEEDETELSDENKFNDFFKNKINNEILGLGMIKYFIDENNVIILSYNLMKDIFNCNICQVKKAIIYIKLYINYINNI